MTEAGNAIMRALYENFRSEGYGLDKWELSERTGYRVNGIQTLLSQRLMYRKWMLNNEPLIITRGVRLGPYAVKYKLTALEEARKEHLASHQTDVYVRASHDQQMAKLLFEDYESAHNSQVEKMSNNVRILSSALNLASVDVKPEVQERVAVYLPMLETISKSIEAILSEA